MTLHPIPLNFLIYEENFILFYLLHLVCVAAKYGNTEVARCLCLAGARIDAKNREGVVAEVCARVQGHASLGTPLFAPLPSPSLFSSAFFTCICPVFYICATFPTDTVLYRP